MYWMRLHHRHHHVYCTKYETIVYTQIHFQLFVWSAPHCRFQFRITRKQHRLMEFFFCISCVRACRFANEKKNATEIRRKSTMAKGLVGSNTLVYYGSLQVFHRGVHAMFVCVGRKWIYLPWRDSVGCRIHRTKPIIQWIELNVNIWYPIFVSYRFKAFGIFNEFLSSFFLYSRALTSYPCYFHFEFVFSVLCRPFCCSCCSVVANYWVNSRDWKTDEKWMASAIGKKTMFGP